MRHRFRPLTLLYFSSSSLSSFPGSQVRPSVFHIQRRSYSHTAPLTYDFVVERVILVLQLYDKIDPEKVRPLICVLARICPLVTA